MKILIEKKMKKAFKGKKKSCKQEPYIIEKMEVYRSKKSTKSLDDSIASCNSDDGWGLGLKRIYMLKNNIIEKKSSFFYE